MGEVAGTGGTTLGVELDGASIAAGRELEVKCCSAISERGNPSIRNVSKSAAAQKLSATVQPSTHQATLVITT